MNKNINRALSILLTLVMLVGLLPVGALAEGETPAQTTVTQESGGETAAPDGAGQGIEGEGDETPAAPAQQTKADGATPDGGSPADTLVASKEELTPEETGAPSDPGELPGSDEDKEQGDNKGGEDKTAESTPTPEPTPTATPEPTPTPTPELSKAPAKQAAPAQDADDETPPAVSFTVTFDANGYGEAPEAVTVESGKSIAAPKPPEAEGFSFLGWFLDREATIAWDFNNDTVTDHITLYAGWEGNIPAPTRSGMLRNGGTKAEIPPEEIKINIEVISQSGSDGDWRVGDTGRATVTVTPENASKDVIWSADPEGIVEIDKDGYFTIIKQHEHSGFMYGTIFVESRVDDSVANYKSIGSLAPADADFWSNAIEAVEISECPNTDGMWRVGNEGQASVRWKSGVTPRTVTWSASHSEDVDIEIDSDGKFRVTRMDSYAQQNFYITATFNVNGVDYSCRSDAIKVFKDKKNVTAVKLIKSPTKLSYVIGEMFDYTGLEVELTYHDGTTGTSVNGEGFHYQPGQDGDWWGPRNTPFQYGDNKVAITYTPYYGDSGTGTIIFNIQVSPPQTYPITLDANGGTVNGKPTDTATIGRDGKLTSSLPGAAAMAHPNDNMQFMGWYTEKSGGTAVDTSTVLGANATIYAQWKDNTPVTTHAVTYAIEGGSFAEGTVTTENVIEGQSPANVPTGMTPDDDHKNTGAWYQGDGDTPVDPAAVSITRPTTFTWRFEPKARYTVTASFAPKAFASYGQVSGADEYAEGSTATLTASVTNPGDFVFLGWYDAEGAQVSTDNPYSFTVQQNANLTAQFRRKLADGQGGFQVSGLDTSEFQNGSSDYVYLSYTDFSDTARNVSFTLDPTQLSLYVDGSAYPAEYNEGVVKLDARALQGGTHSLQLRWAGDENYAPHDSSACELTLKKRVRVVYDNPTNVIYRGENFTLRLLDDADGTPLKNVLVVFDIHGVQYRRTTDEDGVVKLRMNMHDPGEYIIDVTAQPGEEYSEEHYYLRKSYTIDFRWRVRMVIESPSIIYARKDGWNKFKLRLVDDVDGTPVGSGETVSFNINGVYYNRIIDDEGRVSLNINFTTPEPVNYVITAEYQGQRIADSLDVRPGVRLVTHDLTKVYNSPDQFVVRLLDGVDETPLAHETVQFNLYGVLYNRVSDGDGVARLNVRVEPGEYIITTSLNGFNVANKITVLASGDRTVSVSASPEEGGTVEGGGTVAAGGSATVTATPNEGYTFVRWTEDGKTVSIDSAYSFTVTGDRNLTAVFSDNPTLHTVTYAIEGGSFAEGTAATETVIDGHRPANVPAGMTPDESRAPRGAWYQDGGDTPVDPASVEITGPTAFTWKFEEKVNCTVKTSFTPMSLFGNIRITGAGTYVEGSEVTLTAGLTGSEHPAFLGWVDNASGRLISQELPYRFTVQQDVHLTAVFGAGSTPVTTHTVSYAIEGGSFAEGTVTTENVIAEQSPANVPTGMTPDDDHKNTGAWYQGDGTTPVDPAAVSITGPTIFTWKFEPKARYTVSFYDGSTALTALTQTVIDGGYASQPDDPTKEGWVFKGWYADASFQTPFDFTQQAITADTEVYAKFLPIISVSAKAAMAAGDSQTAAVEPTGLGLTFTWKSSDTDVATIDENSGVIRAIKPGTTTITATAAEDSEITASVELTVEAVEISLTLADSLPVGHGQNATTNLERLGLNPRWTSSDPDVASITPISGVIRAHKPGTVSITVTARDNSAITASTQFTVDHAMSLAPFMDVNTSQTASMEPSNWWNLRWTWSSSDPSVASIDEYSGEIQALKPGTTTITATCWNIIGFEDSVELTVFTLFPKAVMAAGDSQTAAVEPTGLGLSFTWESSDTDVASIDENSGVIQAIKPGTTTITATATDGSGLTFSMSLTVFAIDAPAVMPVKDIQTAVVEPSNTGITFVWSSTKPTVASIDDYSGEIEAQTPGTTTITATAMDGSGLTISTSLTVFAIDASPVMPVGWSRTATIQPDNLGIDFTWESSDSTVASIDENSGEIKALEAGTTTIRATATDGSGLTTSMTIKVMVPEIKVHPFLGSGYYTPAHVIAGVATLVFTWESSDTDVATIDENSGYIRALGPGTTTITATAADGSGLTLSTPFTVISIAAADGMIVGESQTAVIAPKNLGIDFTWSSSDPTVASIDPNTGEIEALKPGKATITVNPPDVLPGDLSALLKAQLKATINVVNPKISIGTFDEIIPGQSQTAVISPSNLNIAFTWESSKPEVASIDSDTGVIHAWKAGTTIITVTAVHDSTLTASRPLTVAEPEIVANSSMTVGQSQTAAIFPTNTGIAFTWSSDDPDVASIDADSGEIEALKAGQTTIRATATDGSGLALSMELTVKEPEPQALWLSIDGQDVSLGSKLPGEPVSITRAEIDARAENSGVDLDANELLWLQMYYDLDDSSEVAYFDLTQTEFSFTMPDAEVWLLATYSPKSDPEYQITVTGGTASQTRAKANSVITLTAGTPPEGKVFNYWRKASGLGNFVNSSWFDEIVFFLVNGDAELEVVWKNAPVQPRTITEDDFTALPTVTKVYNASAQTQAVASSSLTANTDYEINYENNINAGTASYTITGKGNYGGTIKKTFTIEKAQARAYPEPVEYHGFYDGKPHALLESPGTAIGGKLQYKLQDEDDTKWSENIPEATDAGSYYVQYRVVGDKNHKDYTSGIVNAAIKKASIDATTITPPAARTLRYTGAEQELVTPGACHYGELRYCPKTDGTIEPDITKWTTSPPKATEVGTYTVRWVVYGDQNHNIYSATVPVTVEIGKGVLTLSLTIDGWTEGEAAKAPVLSGNSGSGAVSYAYKLQTAAPTAYSTTVPTAAGAYTVRATVVETANYLGGEATADFTISPAPQPTTKHTVTYIVVNGTWADGSTTPKTEEVEDGQSPTQIPTGMIASEGFEGGAWSPNPSGATITDTASFTYTFTAKQQARSYAVQDSEGNTVQAVTWQKGSGKSLDLSVHRSEDDHLTYGLFVSLENDGNTVGSGSYDSAAGSLKLSIKPEYLETLSVGDHTVKVNFRDGSATVKLTVLPETAQPTATPEPAPGTVAVEGGKTWDDADDQDGIRPKSITIHLLADGAKIGSVTVTEAMGWKWSFRDLPKSNNGKAIVYTIAEDAVEGYTTTIDGYNVTNVHIPATVELTVKKVWNDSNDAARKRSGVEAKIVLRKTVNGVSTEVDDMEVGYTKDWTYTWEGLPAFEKGAAVTYSVKEELAKPNGYKSDTTKWKTVADGETITIKNTYRDPDITPGTGDSRKTLLWAGLMLTSALGCAGALLLAKRKQQEA